MLLIVIICLPQPRLKEKDYFWLCGFLMYPYFIYSGYIFIEWKTTNVKELCVVFRLFLIRPRTISLTVIFNLVFPCVTTLQSAFTSCLLFLGHIFPLPPCLHPAAAHTQTCTDISSPSPSFCFQDDTLFFFLIFYLFIFRDRGREGEREGEKLQCVVASHVPPLGTWPATQACALTGNQTGDPLVHKLALNLLSHTTHGTPYSEHLLFSKHT